MKIGISLCLGVLMCLNAGCTGKKSAAEEPELTYSNPLSVQFGDPYVLLASDGRYYVWYRCRGCRRFLRLFFR